MNKEDRLILADIGKKPIISDLHKTKWQDMKQKPTDKLQSRKAHLFEFVIMLSIPICKRDFTIIDGLDSMV